MDFLFVVFLVCVEFAGEDDFSLSSISSGNLIISGTAGVIPSIVSTGTYSVTFNFTDLAHNGLDGVFVNLSKNQEFIKINNSILDGENVFISIVSPIGLIQYYNGKCNFGLILEVKGIDNPFEFTRRLVQQNNYKGKGVS